MQEIFMRDEVHDLTDRRHLKNTLFYKNNGSDVNELIAVAVAPNDDNNVIEKYYRMGENEIKGVSNDGSSETYKIYTARDFNIPAVKDNQIIKKDLQSLSHRIGIRKGDSAVYYQMTASNFYTILTEDEKTYFLGKEFNDVTYKIKNSHKIVYIANQDKGSK